MYRKRKGICMISNLMHFLGTLHLEYLKVQILLLPVIFSYLFLLRKSLPLPQKTALHNTLLFSSLVIPVINLFLFLFSRINISIPTVIVPLVSTTQGINNVVDTPHVLSVFTILGFMGVFGTLLLLVHMVYQFLYEKKLLKNSLKLKRFMNISIVYSKHVLSPFSTGIFYPRIFIPSRMVSAREQLVMVLMHEKEHIRKGHYVYSMLEIMHKTLFWYNPLAHLLHNYGILNRECECDSKVCDLFSASQYGNFLIDEAQKIQSQSRLMIVNSFFKSNLKIRISNIMERPMYKTTLQSISILAVCMLLSIGGITAHVMGKTESFDTLLNKPVISGGRDQRKVITELLPRLKELRQLYNTHAAGNPSNKGVITFEFIIDQSGTPSQIMITKSDFEVPQLNKALINKISSWKFTKVDNSVIPTKFQLPLEFSNARPSLNWIYEKNKTLFKNYNISVDDLKNYAQDQQKYKKFERKIHTIGDKKGWTDEMKQKFLAMIVNIGSIPQDPELVE